MFEKCVHSCDNTIEKLPSYSERVRNAVATMADRTKQRLSGTLHNLFEETATEADSDTVDQSRRRFVAAIGAGAALAALPRGAKALERIDPEWQKLQIAQKRLDAMGDPSLKITDFLCDSALPNGADGACFAADGTRRLGPSDEPLIDIPRDQWLTDAQPTTVPSHQTPENPLNTVTVEMSDGTTRTMTQEEFEQYLNDTNEPSPTQKAQESIEAPSPQDSEKPLDNGALKNIVEHTPKSVHNVLVENFDGTRFPVTQDLIDRVYLAAYNSYESKNWNTMLKRMQPHKKEILSAFSAHNVPESLAFLTVPESRFRNVTSPAGARGYFQIMPKTARAYGYNPAEAENPRIAAEIAAEKLAADYKRYTGHAWNGQYDRDGKWRDGWMLTLASYNGGYVQKWFRQRDNRPGTYAEFLQWLDTDINERIIPNEIRKKHLGTNPSPEELAANLPMTLENLTYPAKAFAAADLAVNTNSY